jgi:outer membrane murein-binding lipoprotein Lpp
MEVINPEIRDLRNKVEELNASHARMEGQLELLKTSTKETARQTIWQFIIFAVTIAVILVGGIKYQTDVLRKEMDLQFESQRRETNARFDSMEKRFEDLKQEVRASRK